jgi:hypothetical protein
MNKYGKGGEVLGLVVGYSGEASSDVNRVADLVATRLASKHLEYVRTSASIAKVIQAQRIFRAWGHSFARGFARVTVTWLCDDHTAACTFVMRGSRQRAMIAPSPRCRGTTDFKD